MEVIKKVLINLLTLSRIPLTLLFTILFINNNVVLEISILILIILTDFIDGKISRKFKAESKLGSILDVSCDLFFVVCTSILFNIYDLLHIFYTFIIIFKFIEFNITSYCAGTLNNEIPFSFDKIGKFVSALYQGVPFFIVIPSLYNYSHIYITCLIIGTFISSSLRILNLFHIKSVHHSIN